MSQGKTGLTQAIVEKSISGHLKWSLGKGKYEETVAAKLLYINQVFMIFVLFL